MTKSASTFRKRQSRTIGRPKAGRARKSYLIEVAVKTSPDEGSVDAVQAEREAVTRAYTEVVTQLAKLRHDDPKLVIHPKRPGATMPLFLVETIASLAKSLRKLPGVQSVTAVNRPIRRIA